MAEQNQIRCRTILEILGKPKEHVDSTIKQYVNQVKEEHNVILLKEKIAETKEQGQLWSSFAELELVFNGIPTLIAFCLHYMPSSIEVVKPDALTFKNIELSNFLNDLQAKLHTVDMVAKKLRAENDFLKRNMKASFKNAILILLKNREFDKTSISKFTGIPEEELELMLTELIKESKIKKEENTYSLQ